MIIEYLLNAVWSRLKHGTELSRRVPGRRRTRRSTVTVNAQILEIRMLLSGTNGDENTIVLSGTSLSVNGTTESDDITVSEGTNVVITVNGVKYSYPAAQVAVIYVHGKGSNDTLAFVGTSGDETATLRPGRLDVTGAGYAIHADSVETVRVYSGGGANDRAYLYDSAGNDTFYGGPIYSSLTGAGFFNYASGFDRVNAYATAGGNDTAHLHDSAGNDTFYGRPTHSSLTGAGFFNYASFFDRVNAYATAGGNDTAHLYDSAGNDAFYGRPTYSSLTGAGFFNYASGFDRVNAYATAGGNDTAHLYDSAGNETFYGRPTYSALTGAGFFNYASGFDRVNAYATAGDAGGTADRAYLYDSAGNDTFIGRSKYGYLTGLNFYNYFSGFGRVNAYANTEGSDTLDVRDVDFLFSQFGTWEHLINPVNTAPVAVNGTLTTDEDTTATGTLVATDVDGNVLTYRLVSTSNAHGTVTLTNAATGAYRYAPDANYHGPASFTFRAIDGTLVSNVATVSVTVIPVFTPAFSIDQSSVSEGGQIAIHVQDGAPGSQVSVYGVFGGAVVAFDDTQFTDDVGNANFSIPVPFALLPVDQVTGTMQVVVANSKQAQEFSVALTPGLRMNVVESAINEDAPFTVQVSRSVPNSDVVATITYGGADLGLGTLRTDASGNGTFTVMMPRMINNDVASEEIQINLTSTAANHTEHIHTTLHKKPLAQLSLDETQVKEGGTLHVHVRGGKANSRVKANGIYDDNKIVFSAEGLTDANGQADFSFQIPYRLLLPGQNEDGIHVSLEHDGQVELRGVLLVKGMRFSVRESDLTQGGKFHVEVNDAVAGTLVKVKMTHDYGTGVNEKEWNNLDTGNEDSRTFELDVPTNWIRGSANEDGIEIAVFCRDRWEGFRATLHKAASSSSGAAAFQANRSSGGPEKSSNPTPTLLPRVNQALRDAGATVNDTNSLYFQKRVVNGDFSSFQHMVDAIKWNIQNKRGPFKEASPPPSQPFRETTAPPKAPATTITLSPPSANSLPAPPPTSNVYGKVSPLNDVLQFGPSKGKQPMVSLLRYSASGILPIDPKRTTFVLIHGRITSSDDMKPLANAVEAAGYQVLLLDWTAGAFDNAEPYGLFESGQQGARWILPVAVWAANTLKEFGFAPNQLNLIGHSWGAHVAGEIPRALHQEVNSLIALDPARFTYHGISAPFTGSVPNFAGVSGYSWAFYSPDRPRWYVPAAFDLTYGDAIYAGTADESFVVAGANHSGVIGVFTDILRSGFDNAVGSRFRLSRLLSAPRNVEWQYNKYDAFGTVLGGDFEAKIISNDGSTTSSLTYISGSLEVTRYR